MATDRVVEIEGDPWFVAKDVAHGLGYVQTDKAIRDHCRSARRMTRPNQPGQRGGAWFFTIIPEQGVYRLVMRSKLPAAAAFEGGVVRAVTPAIRKDGGYVIGEQNVGDGNVDEDRPSLQRGLEASKHIRDCIETERHQHKDRLE